MPDPQPIIQTVVQALYALIVLLVPILIRYYAPVVKQWIEARLALAQNSLSASDVRIAGDVARMAVAAVEQLRKNGAIVDNKHAYDAAQAYTEQWLKSRGIVLDFTELRSVIEAAVNDLPHSDPKPVPPPVLPITADLFAFGRVEKNEPEK